MREQEDVLLVHRRDERAIREVVDLMGNVIALVFEISKTRMPAAPLKQRLAQLAERLADKGALLLEQLIEPQFARNQA
jgi:hypothetical protein